MLADFDDPIPPDPANGSTGPGRPRSEGADRALLTATLEILAEDGLASLTMEGIAARAGVSKATLYRRWSSKEAVITAAIAAFVRTIHIPDTGSVEEDLVRILEDAVRVYRGPPGRVLPGLVAAMAQYESLATEMRTGIMAERRRALRTVLERGVRRGELREDIDLEVALDVMAGPLFFRLLLTGDPLDAGVTRGVVDIMLRGLGEPAMEGAWGGTASRER